MVAEGKETREFFDGRMYVMERTFAATLHLSKAWKGDCWAISFTAKPRALYP